MSLSGLVFSNPILFCFHYFFIAFIPLTMFKWKTGTALFNYTMHTFSITEAEERNYTKAAYPTDAVHRK